MKRVLVSVLLILSFAALAACGKNNVSAQKETESFKPDISIDEIEWSVAEGTINGEKYVLAEVTNSSQLSITSLEITFSEKQGITQSEKDAFYADIQTSQGFDDAWMEEFIKSREQLSQPLSMYFDIGDGIEKGESINQIKCYYLGGWTSKNVVYPELFAPDIATIKYEKEGIQYTLYYNFDLGTYELEKQQ